MSNFSGLNYSFLNEDPRVEASLIHPSVQSVLAVCGSGLRVLYLFRNPSMRVVCCDLSEDQLALTHLRLVTVRDLSFSAYQAFWGFGGCMEPDQRRELFESVDLIEPYRALMRQWGQRYSWTCPSFYGRFERSLEKRSKVLRGVLGVSEVGQFSARVGTWRWSLLASLLGFAAWMRSKPGGEVPLKTDERSFSKIYNDALKALAQQGQVANNPFLGMLLFGRIRPSQHLPIEHDEAEFLRYKAHIASAEITYCCGTALQVEGSFDYVSLSNIASYMEPAELRSGMAALAGRMNPSGSAVSKTFIRHHADEDYVGFDVSTLAPSQDFTPFYRLQQLRAKPR